MRADKRESDDFAGLEDASGQIHRSLGCDAPARALFSLACAVDCDRSRVNGKC